MYSCLRFSFFHLNYVPPSLGLDFIIFRFLASFISSAPDMDNILSRSGRTSTPTFHKLFLSYVSTPLFTMEITTDSQHLIVTVNQEKLTVFKEIIVKSLSLIQLQV